MANRTLATAVGEIIDDNNFQNALTALRQRYSQGREQVQGENALADGDMDRNSLADLLVTSINGAEGLPDQIVRVEYLRTNQKMHIPAALGLSWNTANNARQLATPNPVLLSRYWKLTTCTRQQLEEMLTASANQEALRNAVEGLQEPAHGDRFTTWDTQEWRGNLNEQAINRLNLTFAIISKALQFNCDVRDFGYLLTPNATLADNAWQDLTQLADDRFAFKLKPFTLQSIAALNYSQCNNYAFGGWMRAYGLSMGIYPNATSASVVESVFTTRVPDNAHTVAVRTMERDWHIQLIPLCANALAMFGLMHLHKDHTYRANDTNMERIGGSYIQTLRTAATVDIMESLLTHREEVLRTAPHPFGLAQTYCLARFLHPKGKLMPALALRIHTTPPPVQRLFIALAARREWDGLPAGLEITQAYAAQFADIREKGNAITGTPPSYSDLHRLYGVEQKLVISPDTKLNIDAIMPIAYGFAMATHMNAAREKDGLALALSLDNVTRDFKGQSLAWKAAWDRYFDDLETGGIRAFLATYRGQNPGAAPAAPAVPPLA